MTLNELKEKAARLPYEPGVYIMYDASNTVIYVGKAKKLKNRVSQYFIDLDSHTPKTRLMVSKIDHFDVIIASSEFEALVLECSLIKQHMPKYNILLKDDKGYPYIRLDTKSAYPRLQLANRISDDNAEYYGPFGNRGVTQAIIEELSTALMLPICSNQFPRDIGKQRPCLHFHMKQCAGWCQAEKSREEYMERIAQARSLLNGNYKHVFQTVRKQMLSAAENMQFELAATLRDRMQTIESLGKKQLVTALSKADTDAIGYAERGEKACFSLLHYKNGMLLDKEYEIIATPDDPEYAVSSLLKQYYFKKGTAPKVILLPFAIEEGELLSQVLQQQTGKKVSIHVPKRGGKLQLIHFAVKNALEEVERATSVEEKHQAVIQLLGRMLSIKPPKRIEAFDISNIAGTDIVASMVVFVDGKPKKSEYKKFQIHDLADQDDYLSMEQVLQRRFLRLKNGDEGFETAPDLLLIDGGTAHVNVAKTVLQSMELDIPLFGMVKDNRHRTRSLISPDGAEISIETQQNIFSLIGRIQEETHRFAITYHRNLRSKRLRYSQLDAIDGIGKKRKEALLKYFHSISAIRDASIADLMRILPKNSAIAVYQHFHSDNQQSE